jgi:FkbM family methyltransferase
VLAELDLLISVDTSVVHLAGALNRPCWALLAHGPDWRWLRGRTQSAWYPSLRLFRQSAPRQWQEPVLIARDMLLEQLNAWPRRADHPTKECPMDSTVSHESPAHAAPLAPPMHSIPNGMGNGPGLIAQRNCRYGPMFFFKRDKYVGDALARYGEFSQGEADLFAKLVKPGMVVAEVGANIGAHTVMLAKALGPRGELLAFEPQRWVHQIMCANLAVNELLNTKAYQLAVGEAPGSIDVPLWDPAAMNNIGGISMGHIDGAAHDKVELRTLDSFGLSRLDFLKVDVEGMELQVLQGSDATLRRTRPIMYVENDRADRSQALMDHIVSLGYDLWWHFPAMFNKDNFAGEANDIFPGIVSVNLLCIPNERHMDVQGMDRATDTSKDWRTVIHEHNERVTQARRTN